MSCKTSVTIEILAPALFAILLYFLRRFHFGYSFNMITIRFGEPFESISRCIKHVTAWNW
jgi:hypothetical protein